jgi:hypothetical protein
LVAYSGVYISVCVERVVKGLFNKQQHKFNAFYVCINYFCFVMKGSVMKKNLLVFLLLLGQVFAETVIFGTITENSWWTKEKSPYIIINDLLIAQQAKLVIEPGVEVLIDKPLKIPEGIEQIDYLDSFTVAIKVLGVLQAVGTPLDPIVFKGKDVSDTYTHWYGIYIDSRRSQEIIITNTSISSAANGIWVNNGLPIIRNSLFEFNNVGIRLEKKAAARVAHCVFAQNYLAGIRIVGSNPQIYNSIITNNEITGIWGDGNVEITFKNNLCWGNRDKDYSGTNPSFGIMAKLNANGDSTDVFGNLRCDPVFWGSPKEQTLQNSNKKEKKPFSQEFFDDIKDKRYFLSPYSPCIDAGVTDKMFRESDGSFPDLGIWGGAEYLRF